MFGAVHLTNAINTGGAAVLQAIAVSFADFSILSATVVSDEVYAGGLAAILAYPLVAGILLARRRRIEP